MLGEQSWRAEKGIGGIVEKSVSWPGHEQPDLVLRGRVYTQKTGVESQLGQDTGRAEAKDQIVFRPSNPMSHSESHGPEDRGAPVSRQLLVPAVGLRRSRGPISCSGTLPIGLRDGASNWVWTL